MIRKLCTIGALTAAVAVATSGVALADTPASVKPATSSDCVLDGGTLVNGVCTLLGGASVNRHRGDGFRRGGFRRGGFYRQIRTGTIYSYDQVASACGCGDTAVIPTGYTLVSQPQIDYTYVQPQIVAVPRGAVATGDGSCTRLPRGAFGRFGGYR
jgi:hypothetical protein